MRAPANPRYVACIGAKQSSAGSETYVSLGCTTGLLRTCNALRIASLPVLRNDGSGRFAVTSTRPEVLLCHRQT
ncbi:MAG: hypothetical protein LBM98_01590 [Oscillospiraceae bacterium]|nr:hypothetical protein [Oscillospiraceae bacterium]